MSGHTWPAPPSAPHSDQHMCHPPFSGSPLLLGPQLWMDKPAPLLGPPGPPALTLAGDSQGHRALLQDQSPIRAAAPMAALHPVPGAMTLVTAELPGSPCPKRVCTDQNQGDQQGPEGGSPQPHQLGADVPRQGCNRDQRGCCQLSGSVLETWKPCCALSASSP